MTQPDLDDLKLVKFVKSASERPTYSQFRDRSPRLVEINEIWSTTTTGGQSRRPTKYIISLSATINDDVFSSDVYLLTAVYMFTYSWLIAW
jgi:hypothetical protein